MKKLHLDFLYGYPKKEIYGLSHELGKNLTNFLGKELFTLLLDSKILLNSFTVKKLQCIEDETYKLHPAAKALEGFLLKVIKGQKLQEHKRDVIGTVFGKKDEIVRQKIKEKKLIAKTKSVWDFCRNDIMHYSLKRSVNYTESQKKYTEIIETMILLFKDFYGKTEPDSKIEKGYKRYFR